MPVSRPDWRPVGTHQSSMLSDFGFPADFWKLKWQAIPASKLVVSALSGFRTSKDGEAENAKFNQFSSLFNKQCL